LLHKLLAIINVNKVEMFGLVNQTKKPPNLPRISAIQLQQEENFYIPVGFLGQINIFWRRLLSI
jgi:hypothetical protein